MTDERIDPKAQAEILKKSPPPANAIYAGDFNLNADSSEYTNMINTLGQPQDLWQVKHPGEPGFTYATQHLDQRIDYILSFPHLPSNNVEKLMVCNAKKYQHFLGQRATISQLALSFHYPTPNPVQIN